MKNEELVGRERQFCVGLPFVVREFNLVGTIHELHDGANLPAQEVMRWHIREEGYDIQQAMHYR